MRTPTVSQSALKPSASAAAFSIAVLYAASGTPVAAASPSPVAASDPMAAIGDLGPAVSDEELSAVRGKFIRPDDVSFFGISMITSWQDANGVTTTARLMFNVSFLGDNSGGDPVPQLLVGWTREGDPAMDVTDSHAGYTPLITAQQVLPVGELGSTQGAAQANIIAGADNSALNGMQIALVPTSELGTMDTAGLTSITETTGTSFADGDMLEFHIGPNELALALSGNNGSDSALQSVGGDFGRMLQQTTINSDGNLVGNTAAIIIGTELGPADFTAVRATEALSVMRGHGF